MIERAYPMRHTVEFWLKLGLDEAAARNAAAQFTTYHAPWHRLSTSSFTDEEEFWRDFHRFDVSVQNKINEQVEKARREALAEYSTNPRHPIFWYAQGSEDWNEITRRAVVCNAMVRLQREATPEASDHFLGVMQATPKQGDIQQRLEGPDSGDEQCYDVPPSQEPFVPDDYPRLHAKRS